MLVHLHGGLDTYFNTSKLNVPLTELETKTLQSLMLYLQSNYPAQTVFDNGKLKPGHLCIINETDYELIEDNALLNENDNVYFISTMHGG